LSIANTILFWGIFSIISLQVLFITSVRSTPSSDINLVFIILILFIYILKQINLITTPPKIIINYPPDNLIIYDNFLIINGQTEPEVKIKINQEDILLQSDQTFQQKINLLPGINSIIIEGKKKYSSATTLEKKIIYQTEKK